MGVMSEIRVGVSGWRYAPWRQVFYPKGLAQRRELEFASRQVNSIEINGSFYSLQSPASYRKWAAETPDDFVFAIKGSKYISHQKKLREVRVPLANFFGSGMLLLGKKLGPILWQFPEWFRFDAELMHAFLSLLPRTSGAAAALATENTIKKPEKQWTGLVADVPLRYAFEMRHKSFFTPEFIALLRQHNAALAFADTAGRWPYSESITADLVYIRLHGSEELYVSGYTGRELGRWAKKIKSWAGEGGSETAVSGAKKSSAKGRDVYVYFDNDINVHAPFDAIGLAERLGIKHESPAVRQGPQVYFEELR